jgi:hypothetical protein
MSTCFVHVGQAGCQSGTAFWSLAQSSLPHNSPLFALDDIESSSSSCSSAQLQQQRHRRRPCAVFIDSEPNVLLNSAATLPSLYSSQLVRDTDGRGNNWAMGFSSNTTPSISSSTNTRTAAAPAFSAYNLEQSQSSTNNLLETAATSLRTQLEATDRLSTIFLTHSLAGGTGSGFGSALLQHIRDEYPKIFLASLSIAGFKSGDTALQPFNSLFSLCYLSAYADAVIYKENDQIVTALKQNGGKKNKGSGFCIADMNAQIAMEVGSLLFPLKENNRPIDFGGEILANVAPMSNLKYLTLRGEWGKDLNEVGKKLSKSFVGAVSFGTHAVIRSDDGSAGKKIRKSLSR